MEKNVELREQGAAVTYENENGGALIVDISYHEKEQGPVTTGRMQLNVYALSPMKYKAHKALKKISPKKNLKGKPIKSVSPAVYSEYFGQGGHDVKGNSGFEENIEKGLDFELEESLKPFVTDAQKSISQAIKAQKKEREKEEKNKKALEAQKVNDKINEFRQNTK